MSDHSIASIRYDYEGLPVKVVEHYGHWYVVSIGGIEQFDTFKAADWYAEMLGYDED